MVLEHLKTFKKYVINRSSKDFLSFLSMYIYCKRYLLYLITIPMNDNDSIEMLLFFANCNLSPPFSIRQLHGNLISEI